MITERQQFELDISVRNFLDAFGIAMRLCSPKERDIISLRCGLKDGITHTLEEVGKENGVTRERIRQIEAKTFDRIKLELANQLYPQSTS